MSSTHPVVAGVPAAGAASAPVTAKVLRLRLSDSSNSSSPTADSPQSQPLTAPPPRMAARKGMRRSLSFDLDDDSIMIEASADLEPLRSPADSALASGRNAVANSALATVTEVLVDDDQNAHDSPAANTVPILVSYTVAGDPVIPGARRRTYYTSYRVATIQDNRVAAPSANSASSPTATREVLTKYKTYVVNELRSSTTDDSGVVKKKVTSYSLIVKWSCKRPEATSPVLTRQSIGYGSPLRKAPSSPNPVRRKDLLLSSRLPLNDNLSLPPTPSVSASAAVPTPQAAVGPAPHKAFVPPSSTSSSPATLIRKPVPADLAPAANSNSPSRRVGDTGSTAALEGIVCGRCLTQDAPGS